MRHDNKVHLNLPMEEEIVRVCFRVDINDSARSGWSCERAFHAARGQSYSGAYGRRTTVYCQLLFQRWHHGGRSGLAPYRASGEHPGTQKVRNDPCWWGTWRAHLVVLPCGCLDRSVVAMRTTCRPCPNRQPYCQSGSLPQRQAHWCVTCLTSGRQWQFAGAANTAGKNRKLLWRVLGAGFSENSRLCRRVWRSGPKWGTGNAFPPRHALHVFQGDSAASP